MTEPDEKRKGIPSADSDYSRTFIVQPPGEDARSGERILLELSVVCLENWRVLLGLPVLAALVAVCVGFLLGPRYTSSAVFRPQSDQPQASRLAGLAAQFGITVPTGAGGESPRFYEELVTSEHLLDAVVRTEYRIPTEDAEVVDAADAFDLVEEFDVDEEDREVAVAEAVEELRERLSVSSEAETGLVDISIRTDRAKLSGAIAERVVDLVNRFNLETRQSQAEAERKFLGERLEEAREELFAAEDSLETFLQRNRSYQQSPPLQLEYERLQRRVTLRQQVFSSLSESYEQARLDEVRNTPVITVVEPPRVPARPDPKYYILRIVVGLLFGLVLGGGWVLLRVVKHRARRREPERYRDLRDRIQRVSDALTDAFGRLRRPGSGGGASNSR